MRWPTRRTPLTAARRSSPRSSRRRRSRRRDDGRDPADPPARAALPPDRAPRPRRPRGSPRSALRHARGHAGRARRAARALRRRGRPRACIARAPRRDRDPRRAVRRGAPARRARARRGGRPAPRPRHRRRLGADRRGRRRALGRAAQDGGAGRELVVNAQDKALLRRYHENNDLAAREQLIEQYMSLVRSLARRYSYRGEQLEDLVQIGAIGLIKAIDRFDVNRGVELTTYATPNIIGEIKRHFRDRGWSVRVPRGLQELNIQLSRHVEELTVQYGRSPTIAELAKAAGVTDEEVLEALESGRAYTSLSLSVGASSDDEGELDPLESLGTEEPRYEISENLAMLAPGFRVLDERERKILHLRFFEGLTQSQIAQQVGISQMHVSRLIRRSLEKIRDEIAADESASAASGS